MQIPELGIIEGFYGRPWSWDEREATASFLAARGYRFYFYAPKADPYLRRRWTEPHPQEMHDQLRSFAGRCAEMGMRFGVGLTPYELHLNFDSGSRDALGEKLELLNDLGIQDFGILFDDMRGDLDDLPDRQAQIVHWAAERSTAERIFVCPSYYTDDPVLDRVFGARPDGYLERLGSLLDPSIEIFWTGEEVCSRELSPGHLARVSEQLGRKPFLWDNYPVNDGQRMSQYLHLRSFTGRPAEIEEYITGHGINPALQPTLTRIPALTLIESYRDGNRYAYGAAFRRAAQEVTGQDLARLIREDLLVLQDVGLDRLGEKETALRERYEDLSDPAAREIVAWLNGEYRITDDIVQTQ